jgi:hypothetical protein
MQAPSGSVNVFDSISPRGEDVHIKTDQAAKARAGECHFLAALLFGCAVIDESGRQELILAAQVFCGQTGHRPGEEEAVSARNACPTPMAPRPQPDSFGGKQRIEIDRLPLAYIRFDADVGVDATMWDALPCPRLEGVKHAL